MDSAVRSNVCTRLWMNLTHWNGRMLLEGCRLQAAISCEIPPWNNTFWRSTSCQNGGRIPHGLWAAYEIPIIVDIQMEECLICSSYSGSLCTKAPLNSPFWVSKLCGKALWLLEVGVDDIQQKDPATEWVQVYISRSWGWEIKSGLLL